MWRSFWRSIDRFSIQHFKFVIHELRQIKVVHKHNREFVIDLLQSIVEIVTYGHRQDPLIFECFMEYQVLADFVRILMISKNSKIEGPLLQYLSILIQNMDSEHAIYYCFSNDYINRIITHPYEFGGGDLAQYYVSFLRAISGKVTKDTLCLLVKVHGDAVVSFPLYTEALRFAYHEEEMIRIAIRALTLNIYNVGDDMVYQFITTPPVSKYFSDLVHRLTDLCFHLDVILRASGEMDMQNKTSSLTLECDKIVDELYYFKDILGVGESHLTRLVTENLLNELVFPILMSLLGPKSNNSSDLSAITSLYVLSRLLQVVGGGSIINNVAGVVIYSFLTSNIGYLSEEDAPEGHDDAEPFAKCLTEVERVIGYGTESEGTDRNNRNHFYANLADFMTSSSNMASSSERGGILAYVFSDNHSLLLASLFLLLILAESEDLDCLLAPMIGLYREQDMMTNVASTSSSMEGNIFIRFMPEILNALLKVMAFQQSLSVTMLWHIGWCLRKLLIYQKVGLIGDNLLLFNTSYDQCCARLQEELDGTWFDHIPDTLRNEWASCKRALEESSQQKDPLFLLELVIHQKSTSGETTSYFAWQRMIDTVKALILHIQLKTFILKGVLIENPSLNKTASPTNNSGTIHALDVSSASFGSEVSLESGIPCRISFSSSELREIYLIPMASGMTGKLLLAEKHPFRSRRGVVIAIAPLAGSFPQIDEDHPSWLHLRIRGFDPRFYATNGRGSHLNLSDHMEDGRWTLGFPDVQACEAAQVAILNQIIKQRSAVERTIAWLLHDDYI